MSSTRTRQHGNAPRTAVYRALIDASEIARWKVPTGGTDIFAVHDGLPPGLSAADNEAGWREALVEAG